MTRPVSSFHLHSPCLLREAGQEPNSLVFFKKDCFRMGFFFSSSFLFIYFQQSRVCKTLEHKCLYWQHDRVRVSSPTPRRAWALQTSLIPVQKHSNRKKPISFVLNSRSSVIWLHFPLFLGVTLVDSPFFGLATCSPA